MNSIKLGQSILFSQAFPTFPNFKDDYYTTKTKFTRKDILHIIAEQLYKLSGVVSVIFTRDGKYVRAYIVGYDGKAISFLFRLEVMNRYSNLGDYMSALIQRNVWSNVADFKTIQDFVSY